MKTKLLLLLIFLCVGACHTFKKREERQRVRYEELLRNDRKERLLQTYHENLATQGVNKTEEVAFMVDSLYFHPDSGLRLKPGFIKAKIRMLTTSFNHLQEYTDTLRSQFNADAQMAKKLGTEQEVKYLQRKQQNSWLLWACLLLLVALVGCYCFCKRLSPFR